jgi:hypothetical protein
MNWFYSCLMLWGSVCTVAGVPLESPLTLTPPVFLGTSEYFTILSKAGISTVPSSVITGNIGVSPIAATAMTGFSLRMDSSNTFSFSPQVTGKAYASDYSSPTSSVMTTAISDMETAYTDAAGRSVSSPANLNVKSGLVAGTTFEPGVYTWGTDLNIGSDIYITGSNTSVFVFQTAGNIVVGSAANVILVEDEFGEVPTFENIFWQVAGYLDVGTTAHLEGVFLVKTHAAFKTGSSLNGRILGQTHVTLDSATITPTDVQRP